MMKWIYSTLVAIFFGGTVVYGLDTNALIRARAALHDQLYDVAQRDLEALLPEMKLPEEKASVVELLTQCHLGQGQFKAAIDLLEEYSILAWKRRQWGPSFMYWEAVARFELGEVRRAEVLLLRETIEKDHPYYERIQRLRARCHLSREETKQALSIYQQLSGAKKTYIDTPRSMLDWAVMMIAAKEYKVAQDLLFRLTSSESSVSDAGAEGEYWQSRLSLEEHRTKEALRMLEGLVEGAGVPAGLAGRAWLALAEIHAQQGAMSNAIYALARTIRLSRNPEETSRTQLAMARLLTQSERYEEALEILRDLIRINGPSENLGAAFLQLADALFSNKNHATASKAYQEYLDIFAEKEGRGRAYFGKAWCLFEAKRYEEAISNFKKAMDLLQDPEQEKKCELKISDAMFAQGHYELSREKYLAYTRRYPGDAYLPQALFQAALCLVEGRKYDDANKELEKLRNLYEETPMAERALVQRAVIRERQRDWAGAIALYEEYFTRYPDGKYGAVGLLYLGMAQYRLGSFKDALDQFNKLGATYPDDPNNERAIYLKGWATYMDGRKQEALDIFTSFIRDYPTSEWSEHVLFWLAEDHYNIGKYEKAQKTFEQLIKQFPEGQLKEKALYWAGRAANARGEYVAAIELFSKMVELFPDSSRVVDALFWQGDSLTPLGEDSAAILVFEQIIKDYPESYLRCNAWGRKGDCQYTLGESDSTRYEDAIKSYQSILNEKGCSKELILQAKCKIARTLAQIEKKQEALELYQEVVYDYFNYRSSLSRDSTIWLSLAGMAASEMFEERKEWRKAISMYRRVVQANVKESPEAEKRIQKIRVEQLIIF